MENKERIPPKRKYLETSSVKSTQSSPKKICLDHDYYIKDSPKKIKRVMSIKLERSKKMIFSLKKKLKTTQRKVQRYKIKVKSLKQVVQHLKQKDLITTPCEDMLNNNFSGVPLQIMKRITSVKSSGTGKGRKYSDELIAFAMTLQFYSSKAYEYVRKKFDLALPCQADLRRRYAKISADPGFTEPAFVELKKKVEDAKNVGKKVICSLMLDEMSIRKHVCFDGKRMRGYVDLGNEVVDDDSVAKDALVFMVVCVNSSWKVPCAYFFIDGLGGTERANLIKLCIQRLSDIDIRIISVTCDGPSTHLKMLKELGASLDDPTNLIPFFPHPNCEESYRVFALLDICHMLKLVRNTLADYGTLLDSENNVISWKYIIALHNKQEYEGLKLANKLKKAHIQWWQQKMKVNLAAQVFSCSVADALEFCNQVMGDEEFKGCEATVGFIRIMNHLFDILNSRNPFAKGTKAALRLSNKAYWNSFLDKAYGYILGLKDQFGQEIYKNKRKTGFIGFLVGIKSFQGIFNDLVEVPDAPLNYVLTYKYSQDHLELFFGAIRAAGGSNDNPTAQQFIGIYKRLLLRSSIQGGKGNAIARDSTQVLHLMSDTCRVNGINMTTSEAGTTRNFDLSDISLIYDEDYVDAPEIINLSEFKTQIISYIAGYVIKMAVKQIHCVDCCQSLGSKKHISLSKFLEAKDRGGLLKPTEGVIKVCEETEKIIIRKLNASNGKLPRGKNIVDRIAITALGILGDSNVFEELNEHSFTFPMEEENHVFKLIKVIAKCYSKIRFYQLGRQETENFTGQKIRKKLKKLVLFKNQ